MLKSPVVLYLSSRIVAAAGTFFAVAAFSRLAGSAEYGHYLLIYAWATILYAFGTQWVIVAYFGVFHPSRMDEYVASLVQLLIMSMIVLAAVFVGLAVLGIGDPIFLNSVFVLFVSMSVFYNAFEISRSRLEAGAAALALILRSLLIVLLGIVVLWTHGTAVALTYAVALAHLIAAIPCWRATGRIKWSKRSTDASAHLLRYGGPLMLSLGVQSSGHNVDRLLLARYMGVSALGAYGAVADMMRQCFSVVGEAIAFSMITAAKQQYNARNLDACRRTLRTTFNACVAAGAFGGAFFLVFGDLAVRILLAPEFYAQASDLIPLFSIAFAVYAVGQYYYTQVIYFTHASFLLPVYSTVLLIVSSASSIILIPAIGPRGAVLALLIGFVVSYGTLIVISRRYFRMPVDFGGLIEITGLAALFVLGAWLLTHFVPTMIVAQLLQAAWFAVLGGFVVYRYGLLQVMTSTDATGKAIADQPAAGPNIELAP